MRCSNLNYPIFGQEAVGTRDSVVIHGIALRAWSEVGKRTLAGASAGTCTVTHVHLMSLRIMRILVRMVFSERTSLAAWICGA